MDRLHNVHICLESMLVFVHYAVRVNPWCRKVRQKPVIQQCERDIYLYEHKTASVPEWNAFKNLLATPDLRKLNPEQIKQVSGILANYSSPTCFVYRTEFGGRTGLLAFREEKDKGTQAEAFFFVSDPGHRIIEEVGKNLSGATEEEKHDLEEMYGRLKFMPENAKPKTERGVR